MSLFLCCKSDVLALSAKDGGKEGEESFKPRSPPRALLANAACMSSIPKSCGVLECRILECKREVKDKDDSPSVM